MCNPAAGKLWYFKPTQNSTDLTSVTAFQPFLDDERSSGKPILITMVILLILQLTMTLFFYARICYTSYMSTLKVYLKQDFEERDVPETIHYETIKSEKALLSDHVLALPQPGKACETALQKARKKLKQRLKINVKLLHRSQTDRQKSIDIALDYVDENFTKDIKPTDDDFYIGSNLKNPKHYNTKNSYSSDMSNDADHDSIVKLSNDNHHKEARIKEHPENSNERQLKLKTNPFDIGVSGQEENLSSDKTEQTRPKRSSRKMFLPTAEDYTTVGPITGAYKVNIPLTKVVICVSHRDIICTASLTSQMICLCITHMLMIYGFIISGKEVPLWRYVMSAYLMEVAIIFSAAVDPFACILFSSSYRNAAKNMICAK
jgi:hypothetical protein